MVARMLPSILFGPVAGALVDRFDRKRIMITADLSRAVLYATMPFLGKLWAIFFVSFVIESLSLLWTPARDASLPNLVPRRQLANANSLGLVATYGTLPRGGAGRMGAAGHVVRHRDGHRHGVGQQAGGVRGARSPVRLVADRGCGDALRARGDADHHARRRLHRDPGVLLRGRVGLWLRAPP